MSWLPTDRPVDIQESEASLQRLASAPAGPAWLLFCQLCSSTMNCVQTEAAAPPLAKVVQYQQRRQWVASTIPFRGGRPTHPLTR